MKMKGRQEFYSLNDSDLSEFERRCENSSYESGFKKRYEKNDILIETKPLKGTANLTLRSIVRFKNVTPEFLYQFFIDAEYTKVYDSVQAIYETKDILNENKNIMHYATKTIVPVLFVGRDFVMESYHKKIGGRKYIILKRSIDRPDVFPELPGVVRAWVNFVCMLIQIDEENKNDCILTYMVNTDGKARFVPSFLVNLITVRMVPSYIETLRKALKKYPEYLRERECKKFEEPAQEKEVVVSSDEEEEEVSSDEEEEEGSSSSSSDSDDDEEVGEGRGSTCSSSSDEEEEVGEGSSSSSDEEEDSSVPALGSCKEKVRSATQAEEDEEASAKGAELLDTGQRVRDIK